MVIASQMLVFVKVIDHGSFSAAARASGQTPSAVSKQISHLEDHVGHRLLHRTKTGVALTDHGAEYYQKCRAMADTFEDAEAHISNYDGKPHGILHVVSSVAFGKSQLIPMLPKFLKTFPEVIVDLELTDREVDLEEESYDVAITFAEQESNPDFIARKIRTNERVLCASPEFIAQNGMPQEFKDLENYNCLRTSNVKGRNAWTATIEGKQVEVNATGNFEGNSADAVFVVADSLASGALVRLFPAYTQKHADVAAIYAGRRNLAPKIRAFVDYLVEEFAQK